MSRKALYQTIGQAFLDLAALEDSEPVIPTLPIPVPPTPVAPVSDQRIGRFVTPFGLRIKRIPERPDAPLRNALYMYVIKDIFTTAAGNWDPSDKLGSIDQWARDAYLKIPSDPLYIDEGGGDHNLFAMVLGLDGKPMKPQSFLFWSDGFSKLADSSYKDYQVVSASEKSGWANLPMFASSGYYVDHDMAGPWCWCPRGASEVVCGGGWPNHEHVSTFAVWAMIKL